MFQLKIKKQNKKELHNQLDEFYRRIKLKTHFQDYRKQVDLSDEAYKFKSKIKYWVLTKIDHAIDTHRSNKKYIDEQLTKTKKII